MLKNTIMLLLVHSPAVVYNTLLKKETDDYRIGLIMVRFYFLWRSNPFIATEVREWATKLENAHLRNVLIDIASSHITQPAEGIIYSADWTVKPHEAVEDHFVFSPLQINLLYKTAASENVESLIQQLLLAEWVDKSFFLKFIPNDDDQELFLGMNIFE